jgi:signal transduction histidine kinase/response regulator of citrate/malate metabolism
MEPKVLIVDDEVDLEGLLLQKFRKKLRKNEISLFFAKNGIQALEKLAENPDMDIVITDINMPGMDGLSLLGKLNELYPLVKAVVLSAYGDMENIRTAMNRGAFDFLNKPVNFEDLEITMDKTINFVRKLKENETLKINAIRMANEFEHKLSKFMEALPICVSIHKSDGSIFYLNRLGQELLDHNNLSTDVDLEHLSAAYNLYRAGTGKLYPTEEHPVTLALKGIQSGVDDMEIHYDEQIIPLEIVGVPITDENGSIINALAIFQDITGRKRSQQLLKNYSKELEQEVKERTDVLAITNLQLQREIREREKAMTELKQTQIQLVHSEKMAGLGTLVAGVAHEINNPVNFVNGIAQNLQSDISGLKKFIFELAGDEADEKFTQLFANHFQKIESNLSDIFEGSQRIKTIVRDLRIFSRLDEAELKSADVTEGIISTIRLIQAKYKKDVEFICDFEIRREIDCLPAQLNQVFMNIMVNACQAIQEKQELSGSREMGKVYIKTFIADIRKNSNSDLPLLAIEFTDNGPGMTEEVKKRIFEPFFTTKAVGHGTGMGMSITYSIIEKHHGFIELKSEIGKGTTFILYLPMYNFEEKRGIPRKLVD